MSSLDISNTASSNLTGNVSDYSVSSMTTDGATGTETTYQNSNWSKQYGYFCQVPDLKTAIILKAVWLVGKGYECGNREKVILDHVSGFGVDSFKNILFNAIVTSRIAGDSFTEIIRDDKNNLINLKPLDPSSIKIVANGKGIITKYIQTDKITKGEKVFKPEEILHICHNRVADNIHGLSDIDACEKTILADEESFADNKKLMHWQARPMVLFKLKTDDTTKIAAFIAKMDAAMNKGENVYIPDDENILSYEIVQVNPNQAVFTWRNEIRNRFYRTIGLPQIVPGGMTGGTESEAKVVYLGFEQIIASEQRDIEDAIWNQLYLRIKLIPPTSLMDNLQTDTAKDGGASLSMVQQE